MFTFTSELIDAGDYYKHSKWAITLNHKSGETFKGYFFVACGFRIWTRRPLYFVWSEAFTGVGEQLNIDGIQNLERDEDFLNDFADCTAPMCPVRGNVLSCLARESLYVWNGETLEDYCKYFSNGVETTGALESYNEALRTAQFFRRCKENPEDYLTG